jgi:hypothetical protein
MLDGLFVFGCIAPMKRNVLALLVFCGFALTFTGCVGTVDGRSKAGMPFVKDKIESRYERSVPQVLEAARAVLKLNGQITSDDAVTKTLSAQIATRTVYVKVTEADPKVTQVVVQARTKNGGADVDLASEMDKQIALQLATSR